MVKPYNTKEERIYRVFTDELEEWSRTNKTPTMGNQDIRYYLDLQRERLNRRNLRMEYQMKLRGEHLDNIYSLTYKDEVYTNMRLYSHYLQKTAFYRGDKVLYEREDTQMLFQTITKMESNRPEKMYCCPNCGAASPIGVLLEGCPYCHTRFLMSELFPKVTGYYFEHDFFMNEKEGKSKAMRWIFGGILAAFLISAPSAALSGGLIGLLIAFLGSIPLGAFLGYFTMCIVMLFQLVGFAAQKASRLPNVAGTKRRLLRLLQPYDRSFSYEHFSGKIVNLLKIMIFSENIWDTPVYEGNGTLPDFSYIVESVYQGSMGLNKGWIDNGYCYLDLDVYMSDIYDAEKMYRKNDIFRIVVSKTVKKEADLGFSIKKVQCPGCGGSFDATRKRNCPYCGNPYHLGMDDWVVLSIQRRGDKKIIRNS